MESDVSQAFEQKVAVFLILIFIILFPHFRDLFTFSPINIILLDQLSHSNSGSLDTPSILDQPLSKGNISFESPFSNISWLERIVGSNHNHWTDSLKALKKKNIPEGFVRKARTIVGNTERLQLVLRKLKYGQCIRVVVFGGVVSRGTNIGGQKNTWHTHLRYWLNTRYPCGGNGHQFDLWSPRDISSKLFVDNMRSALENLTGIIDLALVEFGIEDALISESVVSWMQEYRKKDGTMLETSEYLTEVIIRLLQDLRTPNPVAMIWLDIAFHYSKFREQLEGAIVNVSDTRGEFGYITSWGHHTVLSYYDIPTISTAELGLHLFANFKRQTNHPFKIFSGKYLPKPWYHTFTGMIVAYNLQLEMQWLDSYVNPFQNDFSMLDPPQHRLGLRVTDSDVERFKNPYYSTIRFNSEFVLRRIKFNRGWELMNPLDINNTNYFYTNKTHAHFAIDFNFTNEFTNIILGFESKFENSSGLHVWFDDDGDTLCDICKSWNCNCQEFSNFFGTSPDDWGCVGKSILLRNFWESAKCDTKPNKKMKEYAGCTNEFELEGLAKEKQLQVVNSLRKVAVNTSDVIDNRMWRDSKMIQFAGTGVHSMHFCLRKSLGPWQGFFLLSVSFFPYFTGTDSD